MRRWRNGRRVGFRRLWATVWVQIPFSAPIKKGCFCTFFIAKRINRMGFDGGANCGSNFSAMRSLKREKQISGIKCPVWHFSGAPSKTANHVTPTTKKGSRYSIHFLFVR